MCNITNSCPGETVYFKIIKKFVARFHTMEFPMMTVLSNVDGGESDKDAGGADSIGLVCGGESVGWWSLYGKHHKQAYVAFQMANLTFKS